MGKTGCLQVATLIVVLTSSPLAADEAAPAVHESIVALTRALFEALTYGRNDVWTQTLVDDAVVIDEFGRRQTKAEIVGDIRPLPAGFSGSIEIRSPSVRQYGDTAVIDCENYEQETVYGQPLVVRYWSTLTFVRRGRDWKLASLHTVTVPTAPPAVAVADLRLDDYPGAYRWGPDRAHIVSVADGRLVFATRSGGATTPLEPIARDVFMDGGDERNLYVFRRGIDGRVVELIERRKFNDLRMKREANP
jgi:hypothetical protein